MSGRVMRLLAVWGCFVATVGLCGGVARAESGAAEAVDEAVEIESAAIGADECRVCRAKHATETSWLKWGLDERLRWTFIENPGLYDWDRHFQDYRTRLWMTVTPVENLDLNARLVWQFTNICRPDGINDHDYDKTPSSNVPFDLLNITWTKVLGQPVTVIAGRQEIRLGDGWLVADGTPVDEFRTAYFDAIRFIWEIEEADTTVNLMYIRNRSDSSDYVKPFNDVFVPISYLDEEGAIAYISNNSLPDLQLDGYFIYKHDTQQDDWLGGPEFFKELYTFGVRGVGRYGDRLSYRGEVAFQFGTAVAAYSYSKSNKLRIDGAVGINTRAAYIVDEQTNTDLHGGYEYRSGGSNPASDFDILWGRYPQWSVLYFDGIGVRDDIYLGDSNLHRIFIGAATEPVEDLTIQADYHLLFSDHDSDEAEWWPYEDTGSFRGQLLTGQLNYVHNDHVTSTFRTELFAPGNYYADHDDYGGGNAEIAFLARYEMNITW